MAIFAKIVVVQHHTEGVSGWNPGKSLRLLKICLLTAEVQDSKTSEKDAFSTWHSISLVLSLSNITVAAHGVLYACDR